MFMKKMERELKDLKQRVEILESKIDKEEDDDFCEKCGTQLIETSQMGGSHKTYLCPRCGNEKRFPWPDLELR